MQRITWMTDIHLNFLDSKQIEAFIKKLSGDTYIISGDIGEAHNFAEYLLWMAEGLKKPIYFVLGNHDFYLGSIVGVRTIASRLSKESPYLHWLNEAGIVELGPKTAMIGHDGWADGRLGDFFNSPVMLNDYFVIQELTNLTPKALYQKLNALGDEAAGYFRKWLPRALAKYEQVYVVTHVPPFKGACWHQGQISDDNFLPHFTCQAAGEALREVTARYPHRKVTVLSGHTHGEGEVHILDNLHVITGGAEYGLPAVQRTFTIAN